LLVIKKIVEVRKLTSSQACGTIATIPESERRLRRDNGEFEDSLDYTEKPYLKQTTVKFHFPKHRKIQKDNNFLFSFCQNISFTSLS
jgi:hypothetical protein